MLRRLFFVIPDPGLAVEVVNEIEHMGVQRDHMHALARDGMDVSALPRATNAQRNDVAWKIEWNLWKVNLAIFGMAMLGFILALSAESATWSVLALAVMLLTFILGALFVFYIPDTHLDEFTAALAHGEIVLMVDVPKRRVKDIETWVDRHHPEAVCGGVGWTSEHFGI